MTDPTDDVSPSIPTARRDFLKEMAAMLAVTGIGLGRHGLATTNPAPDARPTLARAAGPKLIGIQMGPHTMLDEGIDRCLDLIQETAAIDTLFVYSHAYGGDLRKALNVLATDHGVPPRNQQTRKLPLVWVKQHDQYFKNTTLRHQKVDSSFDYFDRDLFVEMVQPARKRGMKIYARILEAGTPTIQNFSKVGTVTASGRRTQTGCWNHPEYKAFWNATAEDLFRSYELDGFQWGAERQGPLMNVLLNGNDSGATCFCEFCNSRGKAQGIDAERARKGFAALLAYVQGLRAGGPAPADGAYAGFLRVIFRYPEILAWEYQYRLSREEIMKGMYDTIKAIKPAAQVGWHVDHWSSSMDPVYRAEMSYEEMAVWSDYLKIVVYHAVMGPRIRSSYLDRLEQSVLQQVPLEEALRLHYDLFGYDPKTEPTAANSPHQGFSPEYVYRETLHSVASANGKTRIYPGVGFNVPLSPPDDPETIYLAVKRSFDAGAAGIVASREYEEMTVPNLKAVGRAAREAQTKAP